MKHLKHVLLLIVCLGLFNCESESTDTPDPEKETDNTLIKRIVYDEGTDDEYTETYNYIDGNKLKSINGTGGDKSEFTYDGDNLVREDVYFEGILSAYHVLEYNTEGLLTKLNEYWLDNSGLSERMFYHEFTYNNDGSIKVDVFESYTDAPSEFYYTEVISFDGKNISKIDQEDTQYIYNYDNKNGIHKNIYAIEILNLLSQNEFGPYIVGNTNNLTSDKEVHNNKSTDDTVEYTSYNENDYPITGIGRRINDGVAENDTCSINFYYN